MTNREDAHTVRTRATVPGVALMFRWKAPVAVAITLVALAGPTGVVGADPAGGANNVVLVSNTVDGSTTARDGVQVAYDPGDTVANQNVASSKGTDCTGCRTVAVAMQVVVVESSPSDFEPHNAAAATNNNCSGCTTYAFAFQYVVQPGRVVYISSTGQQRLASLRRQVDTVTASSLSYDDMKAQLESLFVQIVQTVNDDMRAAGANASGTSSEQTLAA